MTHSNSVPPETKMGTGTEIVEAFDDFMHAFESFKDANDERLGQIETRMGSDVVTEEKMERINKAVDDQKRHLDTLLLKSQRPNYGGTALSSPVQNEHKSGFNAYVRGGDDHGLRALKKKQCPLGPTQMVAIWCRKNWRLTLESDFQ